MDAFDVAIKLKSGDKVGLRYFAKIDATPHGIPHRTYIRGIEEFEFVQVYVSKYSSFVCVDGSGSLNGFQILSQDGTLDPFVIALDGCEA